jgi:hypothetical protein
MGRLSFIGEVATGIAAKLASIRQASHQSVSLVTLVAVSEDGLYGGALFKG